MEYPKEKSKPQFDFTKEKIVLYGQNGIGKTTFIANLPFEICTIFAEHGGNKVETLGINIESWEEYLQAVAIVKAQASAKMLCIDTVASLYQHYQKWFCIKNNVSHEGKIPFIGWDMIARGFAEAMFDLQSLGKGYILLTNSRKAEAREGMVGEIEPNIPIDKRGIIWDMTVGVCDYVFYMDNGVDIQDGKTVMIKNIHTDATPDFFAKRRWPFPETTIPMVINDPAKSAKRLVKAYQMSAESSATTTKETEKKA